MCDLIPFHNASLSISPRTALRPLDHATLKSALLSDPSFDAREGADERVVFCVDGFTCIAQAGGLHPEDFKRASALLRAWRYLREALNAAHA